MQSLTFLNDLRFTSSSHASEHWSDLCLLSAQHLHDALCDAARLRVIGPLRNWIIEANTVETLANGENWQEMKEFLQKVGSNRILRDETLTVSFVKPWNSLAETQLAVRQLTSPSLCTIF